eukprot:3201120-Prorocentrum_lima.AAC.1
MLSRQYPTRAIQGNNDTNMRTTMGHTCVGCSYPPATMRRPDPHLGHINMLMGDITRTSGAS